MAYMNSDGSAWYGGSSGGGGSSSGDGAYGSGGTGGSSSRYSPDYNQDRVNDIVNGSDGSQTSNPGNDSSIPDYGSVTRDRDAPADNAQDEQQNQNEREVQDSQDVVANLPGVGNIYWPPRNADENLLVSIGLGGYQAAQNADETIDDIRENIDAGRNIGRDVMDRASEFTGQFGVNLPNFDPSNGVENHVDNINDIIRDYTGGVYDIPDQFQEAQERATDQTERYWQDVQDTVEDISEDTLGGIPGSVDSIVDAGENYVDRFTGGGSGTDNPDNPGDIWDISWDQNPLTDILDNATGSRRDGGNPEDTSGQTGDGSADRDTWAQNPWALGNLWWSENRENQNSNDESANRDTWAENPWSLGHWWLTENTTPEERQGGNPYDEGEQSGPGNQPQMPGFAGLSLGSIVAAIAAGAALVVIL